LSDIPPARRGMPQIEVTFDIDANGILHVSAKDKATGKEQSIVIKASSGLSEEEVKKMIKDAEENKEQDRKFHELVIVRNQADALIHTTEKSLSDLGEKVPASEKSKLEEAIKELKDLLKGEDKHSIEAKTKELTDLAGTLAQYGQAQAQTQSDGNGSAQAEAQQDAKPQEGEIVDAEFEELKDKKSKDGAGDQK